MGKDTNKSSDVFTLPEGRLINESLFLKDKYNEKSVPQYKVELAFDDDDDIADLEDKLRDFADEMWGAGAGDDPSLVLPFLSGDKMAKKREKKGKDGGAYKDKVVIRANTQYNLHGDDGPGGIQVLDEAVEPIDPANKSQIYSGCYGVAAVVISGYTQDDDEGDSYNGLKFYLSAFQKTKDGERLASAGDRSGLFTPRERKGGEGEGGSRRSRRSRR